MWDICFADMSSHCVAYLFVLFVVSFDKSFSFLCVIYHFFLYVLNFYDLFRNHHISLGHKNILLNCCFKYKFGFHSRIFNHLDLMFWIWWKVKISFYLFFPIWKANCPSLYVQHSLLSPLSCIQQAYFVRFSILFKYSVFFLIIVPISYYNFIRLNIW